MLKDGSGNRYIFKTSKIPKFSLKRSIAQLPIEKIVAVILALVAKIDNL